ncbi:MAG: hypothetical protein WCG87_02210 [Bacteroidota bacterium]
MKAVIVLFSLCFLVCCAAPKKSENNLDLFTKEINTDYGKCNDKVRLDGYYNDKTFFESNYHKQGEFDTYKEIFQVHPVCFFQNGIIMTSNFIDSISKTVDYYKHEVAFAERNIGNFWGIYHTKSDTIYAIVLYRFMNNKSPRWYNDLVYYRGVIKDDSTIVDWKVVAPIPKVWNFEKQITLKPSTLLFKRFDEKRTIDSNRAWVNKFRKQ